MMTIQGVIIRIDKLISIFKVKVFPTSMLRNLLKTTSHLEIRRRIWTKLGNEIGEDVYINNNIILIDSPELRPNVSLGDRVALAPYVTFITSSSPNNSRLKYEEYVERYIKRKPIIVGEDSWIGTSVVIHPGVRIGCRCIIGSCSNVTRDIPDDCLAYGNPAKVIRRLI